MKYEDTLRKSIKQIFFFFFKRAFQNLSECLLAPQYHIVLLETSSFASMTS